MTRPNSAVPKAVPTAVARNATNSVSINTRPQRGPYKPPTGSSINPQVERPDTAPEPAEINPSPVFGGACTTGMERESGDAGTPSVPDMNGVLFRKGPIDTHYQSEFQGGRDPYRKINNPPTRGMYTLLKDYINGIATSQDVMADGTKQRHPQQRTSHMRVTLPPIANGYSPETYEPRQMPQAPNTYKYNPVTGTQAYGTGVLNSDNFGAGQTAGGIGGNQYTPSPGPPDTTSTAGNDTSTPAMPTWG